MSFRNDYKLAVTDHPLYGSFYILTNPDGEIILEVNSRRNYAELLCSWEYTHRTVHVENWDLLQR